jgi:auxin influx carrier (AUX1 LAX family)
VRSEIIDAMWGPSNYDWVYPLSYLFTFAIAAPHSVLVQLSFPGANLKQGARCCYAALHAAPTAACWH